MSKSTTPIDMHVGGRIRIARETRGMTVQQLSQALGVTVAQLQEYEEGSRRVGATSLLKLSQILQTSPPFFFEGLSTRQTSEGKGADEPTQELSDYLKLTRIFMSIEDAGARKKIIDFAASIATANKKH